MIEIILALLFLWIYNFYKKSKKEKLRANIQKITSSSNTMTSYETPKYLSPTEKAKIEFEKCQNKNVILNGDYSLGKQNLDNILKYICDITFNKYQRVGIFCTLDNIINERDKNLCSDLHSNYHIFDNFIKETGRYSNYKMYDKVYFECLNYCLNFNIDIGNMSVLEMREKAFARHKQYFFRISKQLSKNLNDNDYEHFIKAYFISGNIYYSDIEGVGNNTSYYPYISTCHYSLYAILNAYATMHTLFYSYRMKQLLTQKSNFTEIFNALNNKNVDINIIATKLYELFFDDLKIDFNLEDVHDFEKFLETMYSLVITNDGFDIVKKSIDKYLIEIEKHSNVKEYILKFPFLDLIDNLKNIDIYLNYIFQYLIIERNINFTSIYEFYIYDKNKFLNKLSFELNQKCKMQELNRILSGDVSQEVKKTKELYDFKNIKNGFEFEEYVGKLYKKLGYNVEHTKLSGDQGADLIIEKDGIKTVVQTKLYNQPVGNKAVQEVVASISYYNANSGIVVTNNSFTPSAIELAKKNRIELIDGNALSKMIDKVSKS